MKARLPAEALTDYAAARRWVLKEHGPLDPVGHFRWLMYAVRGETRDTVRQELENLLALHNRAAADANGQPWSKYELIHPFIHAFRGRPAGPWRGTWPSPWHMRTRSSSFSTERPKSRHPPKRCCVESRKRPSRDRSAPERRSNTGQARCSASAVGRDRREEAREAPPKGVSQLRRPVPGTRRMPCPRKDVSQLWDAAPLFQGVPQGASLIPPEPGRPIPPFSARPRPTPSPIRLAAVGRSLEVLLILGQLPTRTLVDTGASRTFVRASLVPRISRTPRVDPATSR